MTILQFRISIEQVGNEHKINLDLDRLYRDDAEDEEKVIMDGLYFGIKEAMEEMTKEYLKIHPNTTGGMTVVGEENQDEGN